jgi:tRNA(Ile)-lysidine synthetase-like protein
LAAYFSSVKMSLETFRQYWFANSHVWFSASTEDDAFISQTFGHLLDLEEHGHQSLALIIVYDQVPRHIFRNDLGAAHVIDYFMWKAVGLVMNLKSTPFETSLNPFEWCFFMLPLRHTKQTNLIFDVITKAWARLETVDAVGDNQAFKQMKRYIKASYMRCPRDPDAQRQHLLLHTRPNDDAMDVVDFAVFSDVLDANARDIRFDTVLLRGSKCYMAIEESITKYKNKHIIISLSGGVDSIVCAFVLSCLCKSTTLNMSLSAVHINYQNRDTCRDEEEFVKMFCKKLGINLVIRRIHEINRPKCIQYCLRSLYESYTREVRYNTYIAAASTKEVIVMLGHNKDDCFENILTNIKNKTKYDNMFGMEKESYIMPHGINFLRPLLDVSKREILQCAKACGLPYLYDSTPAWCMRGKIRDIIVPTLHDWSHDAIPAFYDMACVMRELYDIVAIQVDTMVANTVAYKLNLDNFPMTKLVWRKYFFKVTGEVPSTKALECLLDQFQRHTTRSPGAFKFSSQLKKSFRVEISKASGRITLQIRL